jgi:hypothetical protein
LCSFVSKAEQQVKEAVSSLKGQITADQQSLEAQLVAMEAAADASLQSLQVRLGGVTGGCLGNIIQRILWVAECICHPRP